MAYRREAPASLALSPEQQGEVNALIRAAGQDVNEFVWAVQPNTYHLIGPLVSALVHTPTGYSFRFEFLETALGRNRVSVFESKSRQNERKAAASWENQLGHVREWLMRLDEMKD